MVEDEPYDLLPHHEIEELKKQVQELKTRADKSSSQEIVNSLNQLTRSMDAMLRLFTEAAQEVKAEEREESKITEKLDELIDQNKTIAEGIVAVSDIVKDFIGKEEHRPAPGPRPEPRPSFPGPSFQPPGPRPEPRPSFPEPSFQPPGPEPSFEQPPSFEPPISEGTQQGPVAMPSMPFSSLEEKPKKKKGIFGRLKK